MLHFVTITIICSQLGRGLFRGVDLLSSMAGSSNSDQTFNLGSILHAIPIRLSSKNYLLWRNQLRTLLSYHNLLSYVDGSSPPPATKLLIIQSFEPGRCLINVPWSSSMHPSPKRQPLRPLVSPLLVKFGLILNRSTVLHRLKEPRSSVINFDRSLKDLLLWPNIAIDSRPNVTSLLPSDMLLRGPTKAIGSFVV
jgi:hypothetical protein